MSSLTDCSEPCCCPDCSKYPASCTIYTHGAAVADAAAAAAAAAKQATVLRLLLEHRRVAQLLPLEAVLQHAREKVAQRVLSVAGRRVFKVHLRGEMVMTTV